MDRLTSLLSWLVYIQTARRIRMEVILDGLVTGRCRNLSKMVLMGWRLAR